MTFRITESFGISAPKLNESALSKVTEALLPNGGSVPALEVKIAAIHAGLTRNNTFYSKEGLTNKIPNEQKQMSGLESWTKPYQAPILKNHNSEDVDNTIGRVVEAKWIEQAGKDPGHVEITASITNPDAIQKFIRGEYSTGSIGMDVDSAHCSICGEDLKEAAWGGMMHDHQRGKWYKKGDKGSESESVWIETKGHEKGARRMHVAIGNVWAREYSVVAVPSDMRSKVKSFELREMMLKPSEGEELNLLDPTFRESVTPIVSDINDTGAVDDEKPEGKSVAEQYHENREQIESDPVSFFLETLLLDIKDPSNDDGTKLADYIFANNEHLEDELNEIREAVLSTEKNKILPDSCFALVKVKDGVSLRALPYKKADGSLEKVGLRTALLRCSQLSDYDLGFSRSEIAVAMRKLRAAAAKAGLVATTEVQDVDEAKAILAEHNLTAYTAEEIEALKTPVVEGDSTEQINELEEALDEANRILMEREVEADELLEQISELKEAAKAKLVTEILTLEGYTEEEQEDKKAELLAKTDEALQEQHKTLFSETYDRVVVTTRAGKTGLGQDTSVDEKASATASVSNEMVLTALFGGRRARRDILEAVEQDRPSKN